MKEYWLWTYRMLKVAALFACATSLGRIAVELHGVVVALYE